MSGRKRARRKGRCEFLSRTGVLHYVCSAILPIVSRILRCVRCWICCQVAVLSRKYRFYALDAMKVLVWWCSAATRTGEKRLNKCSNGSQHGSTMINENWNGLGLMTRPCAPTILDKTKNQNSDRTALHLPTCLEPTSTPSCTSLRPPTTRPAQLLLQPPNARASLDPTPDGHVRPEPRPAGRLPHLRVSNSGCQRQQRHHHRR